MKRIFALSLSAALILALLGACTAADPETTVISPDPAGESTTVPPVDITQEPSLALPSEEPSEEPSITDNPTHHPEETHHPDPTHHPEESHHGTSTPAPTPKPTPTPTPTPSPAVPGGGIILPGPSGSTQESTAEPSQSTGGNLEPSGPSASDANLSSFSSTILDSYGFPGMMELDTDWIADMFPGLTAIPVVQRVVSVPMMSGTAAALVLVQVENSSDVSTVKSILQNHVNIQISRNANYPAVVESYQNNSQIVSHGSYVMLVVHSECDAIVSQFNALF